jgi:UDP-N-acetylglucosamine acyltransferase
MISKNAMIGKNAQIGENVQIGNFVTIEDDVIIGNNTWIGSNVNIYNGARIGQNCRIYPGAVLAGDPQDLKFKGEYTTLEIGDNNIIRESVTISRGTASKQKTIIGNDNLLMANVHIGHDCLVGNHCIIGVGVGIAGEVIVGDWVNISGLTGIHQFTMIGDHCMIGGLSKVSKDVPPYVIAAREPLSYAGINVVGLRRRGFECEKMEELKEIYRVLFLEKRNTALALELIEKEFRQTKERDNILGFVKGSARGIIKGYNE